MPLLHLMFDAKGMRPIIANWEALTRSLFERVYRESVGRALDEKTKGLIAAQELRIECMYPADDATESHHLKLMKQRRSKSAKR